MSNTKSIHYKINQEKRICTVIFYDDLMADNKQSIHVKTKSKLRDKPKKICAVGFYADLMDEKKYSIYVKYKTQKL